MLPQQFGKEVYFGPAVNCDIMRGTVCTAKGFPQSAAQICENPISYYPHRRFSNLYSSPETPPNAK